MSIIAQERDAEVLGKGGCELHALPTQAFFELQGTVGGEHGVATGFLVQDRLGGVERGKDGGKGSRRGGSRGESRGKGRGKS